MNCPLCDTKAHVEIDLHADGFSQDAFECGDCGGVWTYVGAVIKIIKDRDQKKPAAFAKFTCPTCKQTASNEVDLDAFQFHEELYECTICGTVCSLAHDQLEVVSDSQEGSFLATTADSVESDDYVFA